MYFFFTIIITSFKSTKETRAEKRKEEKFFLTVLKFIFSVFVILSGMSKRIGKTLCPTSKVDIVKRLSSFVCK